jgi:ferredoxin
VALRSVEFKPVGRDVVAAEEGTSLLDAATAAGVDVEAPCGGQGRCGRCKVRVESAGDGALRRSNARLAPAEEADGYRWLPDVRRRPRRRAEAKGEERSRSLARKKRLRQLGHAGRRAGGAAGDVRLEGEPRHPHFEVEIEPPSLADNTSDLDRLRRELAQQHGVEESGPSCRRAPPRSRPARPTGRSASPSRCATGCTAPFCRRA